MCVRVLGGYVSMVPHIPGCERIGSLNLTGDLKVRGQRNSGPPGAACESIIRRS